MFDGSGDNPVISVLSGANPRRIIVVEHVSVAKKADVR
jgi:hypothetical protein